MLEALAKARREQFGDDAKKPNPMRARLHDEIAQAGMTEDDNVESRPSWITMFWPRLTVAAALATLLVLAPTIWWNQSHPSTGRGDVALRDRNAAASDALNPAVPGKDTLENASAMSATGPTVKVADNSQIKVEPAAASEAEAWKSSTYFAQGSPAAEPPSQATNGVIDKKIASAKIQAAPGAVPPAGAESKAKSDTMTAAVPPVSQPSSAAASRQRSNFPNNRPVNRSGTMRR